MHYRLNVLALATVLSLSFGAKLDAASTEAVAAAQPETMIPESQGRTLLGFDRDWRFSKGDFPAATVLGFDDSGWRQLDVPHDWSSEGPFGPEYASGNGYAPGGLAWYRKHFRLDPAAKGNVVALEFDGIYQHSEVWINGHWIGGRPYGYSSFECVLSPHLNFGSADNVVAVRVDHSRFADSRWYTGSGIYRHVRLRITGPLRIAPWGVFVTTALTTQDSTVANADVTIINGTGKPQQYVLESEILSPEGQSVGRVSKSGSLSNHTEQTIRAQIRIEHPQLWSVTTPRLFTLKNRLLLGSTLADATITPFGVRTLQFDPDKGFLLNGAALKLKGVCIHHDAGSLGAAVPEKLLERRLRILKELGVNAIRTSHNPPAPELLDLCDRLGLLVKDEAFDEFTPAKNKWINGRNVGLPSRFGYAEDFPDWSVRDVQDMVRRDRNHPCVILWSIGNEIDYANDPFSHPVLGREYRPANPAAENLVQLASPLIAAVRELDRTRPVTAALANVAMSDAVGLGEMLDVAGYNYQEARYPMDHAKYPKRILYGSETSHTYDNWAAVRDNDYVAGQFLWTGIDYLGEAGRWPNRGSSAGLLDLCGFKKPLAWFRQSLWSDQPMVYLCANAGGNDGRFGGRRLAEKWNWPSNATVSVRCYTTCPQVRLTLNGRALETKRLADATDGTLSWQVPFEPGVLEAVGGRGAEPLCKFALKTAGPASRLELLPEATSLVADGSDIVHVEYQVVDAAGVRVPDADNEVAFAVEGPGELLGLENGDMMRAVSGGLSSRPAYQGRGLAILRAKNVAGRITLKASSTGLMPAIVVLESRSR